MNDAYLHMAPGEMVPVRTASVRREFIIAGRTNYRSRDGQYSWAEYTLDGTSERLTIDHGSRGWLAILWASVPRARVTIERDAVVYQGRRYRVVESDDNTDYENVDRTEVRGRGRVEYFDYKLPDQQEPIWFRSQRKLNGGRWQHYVGTAVAVFER